MQASKTNTDGREDVRLLAGPFARAVDALRRRSPPRPSPGAVPEGPRFRAAVRVGSRRAASRPGRRWPAGTVAADADPWSSVRIARMLRKAVVLCGFHVPRLGRAQIRCAIGSRIEPDFVGRRGWPGEHPHGPNLQRTPYRGRRSRTTTVPASGIVVPCPPGSIGKKPGRPAAATTTGSATPTSDLRPRSCARASSSPDRRR